MTMPSFKDLTADQQRDVYLSVVTLNRGEMEGHAMSTLDDKYGTIEICGLKYTAVHVLQDIDPIACDELIENEIDRLGYVGFPYSGSVHYALADDINDAIEEILSETEESDNE